MKTCTKCGIEQPKTGFYPRKANKDGFSNHCASCCKKVARNNYLKKHPEARENSKEPFDAAKSRSKPSRRSVKLLYDATKRAHRDGAIVTITKEWIEDKLLAGVCELTGIPFDFSKSDKWRVNPYSPSLDKVDSNVRDYTPENTRVILFSANSALGVYGEKIMLDILKKMVQNIENKKGETN